MAQINPEDFRRDLDELLDDYETQWQSQTPPSFPEYLQRPAFYDEQYLGDLIELDLEYRWKPYRTVDSDTLDTVDVLSFPRFPRLLHYVESYGREFQLDRDWFNSAEMLAKEYRVRKRWGDTPERDEFRSICSSSPEELEAALDRIDTELQFDCAPPLEARETAQSQTWRAGTTSGEASQPSLTPGKFGTYQLLVQIGRGGYAEVWRAWDPNLQRDVAIKLRRRDRPCSPALLNAFRVEAHKLAQLEGIANIVPIFDLGEEAGVPYLVSQFIAGDSLADCIARTKPTHDEVIFWGSAIARAVQEAHNKHIIHRDIKPDNVLLDEKGKPSLADFGLAATRDEQNEEPEHLVGTIPFMSPEQVMCGNRQADHRVDIYGLGVLLYCGLTQRNPFYADSIADFRKLITEHPPQPPREIDPTIPEALEAICLKCLEKDPNDRYATAGDVADALLAVPLGVSEEPSAEAERLTSPVGAGAKYLVRVGVVLLAVVAASSVGYIVWGDFLSKWFSLAVLAKPIPRKDNPTEVERVNHTVPERNQVPQQIDLTQAQQYFRHPLDKRATIQVQEGALTIESDHPLGVKLFHATAFRYKIRLRLRIDQTAKEQRVRRIGVFFGDHPDANSGMVATRFQTIQLERSTNPRRRRPTESKFLRTVSTQVGLEKIATSHQIGDDRRDAVEPGDYELELTIGSNGLDLVKWNHQSLSGLTAPEVNGQTRPEDYTGGFGIVTENGRVTILKCEYIPLQQSNDNM